MKQVQTKSQAEVERCWPSIEKVAPCQNACPLNVDVPGYVMAVTHGNLDKALAIVTENNPLPIICGRVCHHPCEASCLRAEIDEPIAIRSLKRFIINHTPRLSVERPSPVEKTRGESVAIIGSGPAGLAAAHDLARQGYAVTVYEALSVVGGMLILGIPEFVLPREILQAEISSIEGLGVEVRTSTPLGKDLTIGNLFQQGYKAVFISVGAQQSLKLNIPGIDLKGVSYALALLEDVNLGKEVRFKGKVTIIGGGNVAVDCARVAIRSGATEVNLTCLESRGEMPGFPWEIERAEEEGVKIYPSLAPQEITDEDRKVTGINFARVKSIEFDAEGRIRPILVEGEELTVDADAVIVAIGQTPDLSFLDGAKELEVSKRGAIQVDPDTLATNVSGVFAGGDVVNVATVVEAIAAGKKAAISIDRYLRGLDLKEGRLPQTMQVVVIDEENMPRFVEPREHSKVPMLPVSERVSSFREVELGFAQQVAIEEAKRCLNCPVCGNCVFGRAQMCYETATRLL